MVASHVYFMLSLYFPIKDKMECISCLYLCCHLIIPIAQRLAQGITHKEFKENDSLSFETI